MQTLLDKLKGGDGAVSAMLWIGLGIIILLVVLMIAVWLIRALRPTLNMAGGTSRGGRPQRLAVTDWFQLDRDGRKLVIVRRDNTEHLLLIGGPNDVLVETNILRSERSSRGRGDAGDSLDPTQADAPRMAAVPAPQPTAPQPVVPPVATQVAAPTPLPNPLASRPAAPPPSVTQPPARPVAPPAAGPQRSMAPSVPPQPPVTLGKIDDEFERALAAMQDIRPGGASPAPARPPVASRPVPPPPAPPMPPTPMPPVIAAPQVPVAPTPVPVAPPPPPAPPAPVRSEPMSEMARRLNEVLQKPLAQSPASRSATPISPPAPVVPAPAPVVPPMPVASPPPVAKGGASIESEMDLLEEEMARLLGRPGTPGKPGSP